MSNALQHNLGAHVKTTSAIDPAAAVAGAINGTAIDRQKYTSGVLHLKLGGTAGTPSSFTVPAKVQESADGTTGWTDVTDATIAAVTVANGQAKLDIDLTLLKRHVRAVVTPAFVGGTAPTVVVTATWTFIGIDNPPA